MHDDSGHVTNTSNLQEINAFTMIYKKLGAIPLQANYSIETFETDKWLYAFSEAISADKAVRVATDEVHLLKAGMYMRIRSMNIPDSGYKFDDSICYRIEELISEYSDTILELDDVFRCIYGDVKDRFGYRTDFQLTQLLFDFQKITAFMHGDEVYGKKLSAYKVKHGKRKFSCSLKDRMNIDPFKFGVRSIISGPDCQALFAKLSIL